MPDGLITRRLEGGKLLSGLLFLGGEFAQRLLLFRTGLVQRPGHLRQLLPHLCQDGFLVGDFRFQRLSCLLQLIGFRVHRYDGLVLPRDLVLEPLYSRGQLGPRAQEGGEVLLQLGLGRRKERVLPHQRVPDAGQFPSPRVQFLHRGGSLAELGGQVVDVLECIVPFGRQGGHAPAITFHGPAPFGDGGVELLPDLGERARQLVDLPPGVRELLSPLVEHALAPAHVLRKLPDPRFEVGHLFPPLLQVLRQRCVLRLHALLLAVQLLVLVDGDARG